ncbi:AraC family transcriptional regulator, partial [Ligaoa zhengdingensis]
IGISNQSPSLDDLRTLHHQAERACSMRVVLGLNKNIIYNAIDTSCKAFDKELLEQRMRDLKVLLNDNDLEALQQVEKLYIPDLMDGFMEANYFRYVNNRLYGVAMEYLYQNNLSVGEVLENDQISLERIEALETASEMSGYFSRLFGELLRHEAETAGTQGDLTERVKRYVEQNYDKEITLSDIADTVHVHKGYLCRAFKEKTGENLMQYVVAKKIEKAKEMLEDQSLKLYEISNALSFATPQYFSMVFKKQTGMTPNEYKKSLAAK